MDEKEDFNKDFEKENKEEGTEKREDEVSSKHLKEVSGGQRQVEPDVEPDDDLPGGSSGNVDVMGSKPGKFPGRGRP